MTETPSAMLNVERQDNQFLISGPSLSSGEIASGAWSAVRLDAGRVFLVSKESGSTPATAEGFAKCSIDMLHDLLVGLSHRSWSGMVTVDTGFGLKKLYFNKGELTFAGSSLMDDRLGEVIYREGMISMDQLTGFAVQVDRNTKFGQALLRSSVFTNSDLWNALKSQVREIFRSTFLVPEVYVEISKGTPPTEVTFDEGTDALIESAHCFGAQFRAFFNLLTSSTQVWIRENTALTMPSQGTFLGDMLQLVRENPSLENLLSVSTLTDINTLFVVHRMVCFGFLRLEGLSEGKPAKMTGEFANIKSKIDVYGLLGTTIFRAFSECGVAVPLSDLQRFALSLNTDGSVALCLESDGLIGHGGISNILSQCHTNAHRIRYFEIRLDSLTRYLLQVAGDMLPYEKSKAIRREYMDLVS